MILKENVHLALAVTINLFFIGLLVKATWNGSDKAMAFVIFYYPLLILINSFVWIILKMKGKKTSLIYRGITIGLIVMFVPVLMLATLY